MDDTTSQFRRASRLVRGYDISEVDEFFERAKVAYELAERGTGIDAKPVTLTVTPGSASVASASLTAQDVRVVAFSLRRRGYVTADVDARLDLLEDALAAFERDRIVTEMGEEGLITELTDAARVLQGRLERPEGERFGKGLRGWERTYDVDQVDRLCDRLWSYFNEGSELDVDEVRRSVFKSRRGNLGYREPEVDAFLDRVVSVMVAT